MLTKWLTALSFVCFGILTLLVVEMTRRPLCIESRVVEKVDRISVTSKETAYRCALNKQTEYTDYFREEAPRLAQRLQSTERLLESLEPFYRKIHISILVDHPYLFKVQGHKIFIGEELYKAPGHLEKALAKIWYRERNETLFLHDALAEELVTDFLLYVNEGDLNIGDPRSKVTTAVRKAKWPYVLKSESAYCASPWKKSEHFVHCEAPKESPLNPALITEMSLRPLLFYSWVRSYKSLNMNQRYAFTRGIVDLIRSEHTPGLPLVLSSDNAAETTLERAARAVRNISNFVAHADALKRSETQRLFVSSFTSDLRENGFQDTIAEANFDLLFISAKPIKSDAPVLQAFTKLAKKHPQKQLALQDNERLWMLPSEYSIPLESFGQIKANRTIVEKCGNYDFDFVLSYASMTEKVLIVDHCAKDKDLSYSRLLTEGTEGFAAQNKGRAFVQFHLPSLVLKQSELQKAGNVFEFIRKRDVENPSFRSLGWLEVRWDSKVDAYQPKAFVDAIEWFRMPN